MRTSVKSANTLFIINAPIVFIQIREIYHSYYGSPRVQLFHVVAKYIYISFNAQP